MSADRQLRAAIRALKIYDDVVQELSAYVGHMHGRCGEQAQAHAVAQCEKAMHAKKIFDRLVAETRGKG